MINTAGDQELVAYIRRLASDGARLYVRFNMNDITRVGLAHGEGVELNVGGKVCVTGVVKTSGGTPWLAPGHDSSNAAITEGLRKAGFDHGDDVPSVVRVRGSSETPAEGGAVDALPAPSASRVSISPGLSSGLRFDSETAIGAIRAYNVGEYRGRANLEIDRIAYERFRAGLPDDEPALIEMIRFVGEDYGGAQRRFLPHSYREEAGLIVAKLRPGLDQWRGTVVAARPLAEHVPDETTLAPLLAPFVGTKRWPVWASKTLHFLRPDAFPILDSRAKKALNMASLGSSPRDYHRFCSAIHDALVANHEALADARGIDGGASPSDLKLLDKILYQLGDRR